MPLQDYFNPNSMNPANTQGGWKPEGFAAGLDYYNRQKDYQDMLGLQKMMVGMDIQSQKSKLEDYESARPSALLSTINTNVAEAANVGMRKQGEAKEKFAKGEFDFQTLNSKIDEQLGSNDEKKRERGLKSIQHGIQVIDILGPAIESGDKTLVRKLAKGAGIKDTNPMIENVLNAPNPQEALAKWRAALEAASARNKAGEIKLKGGFDIQEREIMADASKFGSYLQYLAAQYRSGSQQAKEKLEGLFTQIIKDYFTETDPTKKAALLEKVNMIKFIRLDENVSRAPYNPSEFRSDVIGGNRPNPAGAPAARSGAFPPVPPLQGGQQPQQPMGPVTQQQVEAAGERFQPEVYEYQMINGQLMKRRK